MRGRRWVFQEVARFLALFASTHNSYGYARCPIPFKHDAMHHYTESGLQNVWLENGYHVRKTPYGDAVGSKMQTACIGPSGAALPAKAISRARSSGFFARKWACLKPVLPH